MLAFHGGSLLQCVLVMFTAGQFLYIRPNGNSLSVPVKVQKPLALVQGHECDIFS